jgi:hypothetical protein
MTYNEKLAEARKRMTARRDRLEAMVDEAVSHIVAIDMVLELLQTGLGVKEDRLDTIVDLYNEEGDVVEKPQG